MEAYHPQTVDFFLGTTTPAGFHGYFRELGQEPGMQLYLIKSGPGCGKSTMMKQLAQLSRGRSSASIAPVTPIAWTGWSSATSRPPSWMPQPPTPWSRWRQGPMRSW